MAVTLLQCSHFWDLFLFDSYWWTIIEPTDFLQKLSCRVDVLDFVQYQDFAYNVTVLVKWAQL